MASGGFTRTCVPEYDPTRNTVSETLLSSLYIRWGMAL